MLILVTNPEAMAQGRLAKTFYTIPENRRDVGWLCEYGECTQEAERLEKQDKFNAAQFRQESLKLLLKIFQNSDHVVVDDILKPAYRFGRLYALGMTDKLFKGLATKQDLKVFKEPLLRRIQTARFKMKNLRNGAGERWAKNVTEGKAS